MAALTRHALIFALAAGWPCLARATEPSPLPAAPAPTAVPVVAKGQPPQPAAAPGAAQQYCQNIATAASDAHFAWQAQQLKELETQLQARIAELDVRQAEYKDVLAKRDAALKQADQALVGIYAKMRPDAAAAQLSALDDDMAAAVLARLNPRQSSAILNEVQPDRAVHLINAIANPLGGDGKKS